MYPTAEMKEMKVHNEDLHGRAGDGLLDMYAVDDVQNPTGFDAMDGEEEVMGGVERETWLENEENDLLDVNGSSIFYNEFPTLPDFSCMSSSSSTSSTPAPTKPFLSSSASSSSSTSWAVLKSDGDANKDDKIKAAPAMSSTVSMDSKSHTADIDCMDVMENFGYMDLIDTNSLWDPSYIFQSENSQDLQQGQQNHDLLQGNGRQVVEEERRPLDELGGLFFEWLQSNRANISAEDMKNIKLKRSTIESASKRLGSTKEGKKQLLKLILDWVEQYQLQKKRKGEEVASEFPSPSEEPLQNPNPSLNLNNNPVPADLNACFSPPPWPPYVADPTTVVMAAPPAFPPSCNREFVTNMNQTINFQPNYPPTEYQMLHSAHSWPQYNSFPDNTNCNIPPEIAHQQPMAFYGDQYNNYPVYNGEGLLRMGASATKEARKNRMARQRRFTSHHHQHRHNRHENQQQHQGGEGHSGLIGRGNCTNSTAQPQPNPGNWVYWPSTAAAPPGVVPMMAPMEGRRPAKRPSIQAQNHHRQAPSDRRQGWKPEKNLKFLLQKVLKQSDVGNLGRIVLPKKEAETHLPGLDARDGISIAMEDIGTSRVWNMRYRFWPNNKSRMYLLENTVDKGSEGEATRSKIRGQEAGKEKPAKFSSSCQWSFLFSHHQTNSEMKRKPSRK